MLWTCHGADGRKGGREAGIQGQWDRQVETGTWEKVTITEVEEHTYFHMCTCRLVAGYNEECTRGPTEPSVPPSHTARDEVHTHMYARTSLTWICSSLCSICEKLLSSGRENPDHWEQMGEWRSHWVSVYICVCMCVLKCWQQSQSTRRHQSPPMHNDQLCQERKQPCAQPTCMEPSVLSRRTSLEYLSSEALSTKISSGCSSLNMRRAGKRD